MGPEFGPVFGASEYWHISRGLRKRSHFGACILVLANHFRAHFWNRTIWTWSDHFFSNMQLENSKVQPVNACLEHVFVSNNQIETCCILKRSANNGVNTASGKHDSCCVKTVCLVLPCSGAISKRAIPMSSPSLPAFSCNPHTHTHTHCVFFSRKKN